MLLFDEDGLEDNAPIHAMIQLPNRKLYDGTSMRSQQDVVEEYETEFPNILLLLDRDGSILNAHYNTLGSGVFNTCHKNDFNDIFNIINQTLNPSKLREIISKELKNL